MDGINVLIVKNLGQSVFFWRYRRKRPLHKRELTHIDIMIHVNVWATEGYKQTWYK